MLGLIILAGGWVYTEQSARLERLQNQINISNTNNLDHERRLVALEVRFEEIVKKLDQIHEDVKDLKNK
jgi:hypothetical protein